MDHFRLSSDAAGFRRFTRESLATIEKRIAEKKAKQAKSKLENSDKRAEVEECQPDPDLRACRKLPSSYGDPPVELIGEPLEDLDPYYSDQKTFMVLNKKKTIFRFTATPALFILSPFHPLRRIAIKISVNILFIVFITITVLINCAMMILPDFPGNQEIIIESTFTGIYTCEILIKVLARGFLWNQFTFLQDPWNVLDFVVTVVSCVSLRLQQGNVVALRTFRIFRSLKAISLIPGLQVVTGALIQSVKKLADVIILTICCLSFFALVGLQLFMGNLKRKCVLNDDMIFPEKTAIAFCNRMNNSADVRLCGYSWNPDKECPQNYSCRKSGDNPDFGYTSFDNFGWAFLSVFRLMAQDTWEKLYRQTIRTSGKTYMIFFIVVIFLCSFYLFNLILAVVTMSYEDQYKITAETKAWKKVSQEAKELQRKKQEQMSVDTLSDLVRRQKVMSTTSITNTTKLKLKCAACWHGIAQKYLIWDCCPLWMRLKEKVKLIVMDPFTDLTITVCIVVNTIFMALEHSKMTRSFDNMIITANQVFTGIFTAEMIFKIIALDPYYYFQQGWNIFDSVVVMVGIISLILREKLTFFRLLRIFKLSKSWPALNTFVKIMRQSIVTLSSLELVLGVTVFIFAVVGKQVLGRHYCNYTINTDNKLRWHMNDFFHSFLIVFRILCGEWIENLWTCMKVTEKALCLPFFFLVLVIGHLLVLNLFVALLLKSFETGDPPIPDEAEKRTKLQAAVSRLHRGLKFMRRTTWDLCCKILRRGLKITACRKAMVKVTTQNTGGNYHDPMEMREEMEDNYIDNGIYRSEESSPVAREKEDFMINCNTFVCVPIAEVESYSDDYDDENGTYTKMEYTTMQENQLKHRRGQWKSSGILSQYSEASATVSMCSTSMRKEKQKEGLVGNIQQTDKLDAPKDCFTKGCVRCSPCCAVDITKFPGSTWWRFRKTCYRIIKHSWFETFIIFVILLSSAALAFEDIYLKDKQTIRNLLVYADIIFAYIFLLEMFLEWVANGFQKYFTDFSHLLDFFIVCISFASFRTKLSIGNTTGSNSKDTLKSFRTLRALRPLRMFSRLEGIKVVVEAMKGAICPIMNIMLVCLVVWLPFNILGVQLFKGKFWKCTNIPSNLSVKIDSRNECQIYNQSQSLRWENSNITFDHVGMGYLALLQVAVFKGWMDIMYDAVDSREEDLQPIFEYRLYMYLYFVSFIMIGSFFMMNLFTGVVIKEFNKQRKKIKGQPIFLTETQKKYYKALKKFGSRKPQKQIPRPLNKYQGLLFDIVSSDTFDITIMVLICLNAIVMMGYHEDQHEVSKKSLEMINKIFVIIFTGECLMKIVALRHYFFTSGWNIFDLNVVIFSLVDVATGTQISPSLLRAIRLVRIVRILRLIRQARGIRALLFTLVMSLPALFNIGLLLFLVMYIYAILGMDFFPCADWVGGIDDIFNFQTFGGSMLCLFQITTSDGWNSFLNPMLGTGYRYCTPNSSSNEKDCCVYWWIAIIYFVSYIVISFLIVTNMYIAVILENLNVATEEIRDPLCEDDFEMFYEIWGKFDPGATQFIEYSSLSDFADALPQPLRVPKPNKIQLIAMDLPIFSGDRLYYWDILLAFVKRVLGESEEMDKLMMEKKVMIAIPPKLSDKPITTTLRRREEEASAIIIQRAFRSHLSQYFMKQASLSYHKNSDSSIFEEAVPEKESLSAFMLNENDSSQLDKSETASFISFPPSYDSVTGPATDNLQGMIAASSKTN